MIYKNENLNEISFPLGGIGSGCIGVAGNGGLVDWEIFNKPNKRSENRYSHFAVRAFDENENVIDARVLVGDIQKEFNHHGAGTGVSLASMNGFPHFKENTFDGEFPIADLYFDDEEFPGRVHLEAFNPFIPLDSKNSSIPAAFFSPEIENTTNKEIIYEIAFSVRNPFSKTVNKCIENGSGVMLFDAKNNRNNLTVAAAGGEIFVTDYWYRGWRNSFYMDNIIGFWNDFSSGKKLISRNYEEASSGDVCTVSSRIKIKPGEKKAVKFVLSWSIPDCVNYWFPYKDENGNEITWKNYYATVFEDSLSSAEYSLDNWNSLYSKTKQFKTAVYSSTLDESMKQAIGAGLAVLKSPTVMRFEDGSLYGFEGAYANCGSCEGLCQHVWNYAYVCCYLFPDLEMSIRNNEFKYGVLENGETVFRLPTPFDRKVFVNMFDGNKTKYTPCVDGQMGIVIKTYREWKLSGDSAWLKQNWETVKKVLEYAWSSENEFCWDENGDGVLEGRQHHTLDCELFGANAWLEGFYLAALKAAEEMADFLGDTNAKQTYSRLFENGYEYTKNNLFSGEYFIQQIDINDKSIPEKFGQTERFWNEETGEIGYQLAEGCFIDQLCGGWHAMLCGLGDVFDKQQTKTAAFSVYKNNFMTSMRGLVNPWRLFAVNDEGGTIMCTYPENVKRPENPVPYCEEVMSGFEYSFACVLMSCGYMDEAINVVREVRKKYDGAKRNPWNDIECGNNYVRSMAAFSFLPALCGFTADMPKNRFTFNPVTTEDVKSVWSVATGWGTVEISDNYIKLDIKDGYITLKELYLPFVKEVESIEADGKNRVFSFKNNVLEFENVTIKNSVHIAIKKQ